MAFERCAHRVEIVLAQENNRKLPQRGQIQRFVELAFGDGAVAEIASRDRRTVLHLVCQRQPDRNRQSASDDCVSSVESPARVKKVHRAAMAVAAARALPIHFGHQYSRGHSPGQRVPVFAIGGNDRILRSECLHRTHAGRFLSDVEMKKAVNLLEAVHLRRFFLEAADAEHLSQEEQRVLAADRCARRNVGCRHSIRLECGNVPFGETQFARLEQPAHDLATARPRH